MVAGELVGRQSEMERIRAFLAAARTDGAALLVTGEPGVGKSVLLNAATETTASAGGMRILRAAGVQFEAETSFSGRTPGLRWISSLSASCICATRRGDRRNSGITQPSRW